MRDALIANPRAAADYAALKFQLARTHADDLLVDTHAKTGFVQRLIDAEHDRLGRLRVEVFDD